ncbi:hypothetical protein [Pseudoalteromonas tunicata]|uniref:hypothetical protein n=1 Tax=Pseudoalteromonas tunicata TaxID=314281 RepID=UPI00273F83BF|nr:hypothetical protein [Pseudoalteromonas tunicata]MDP4985605.1 hypothetical protein [Pseudoalteromonas tunicata]MDP5214591.1 hypothetical protein [Pseudoalteromonas tunicata]
MKLISTLTALAFSFGVNAVEPIYVGGTQYSYTEADFNAIHLDGNVIGYETEIDVLLDEYDEYLGGYPELIFDVSGHVVGTIGRLPMKVEMDVTCSGKDIGYDADLIINRRGQLTPARFSIYNRLKTEGQCKKLKLKIKKMDSSTSDTEATIDAFNVNLTIYLNLM